MHSPLDCLRLGHAPRPLRRRCSSLRTKLRRFMGNIRGQRVAVDTAHFSRTQSTREPVDTIPLLMTLGIIVSHDRTHQLDRPSLEQAPLAHRPMVASTHLTFSPFRKQSTFQKVPQRTSLLHHSNWSGIRSPRNLGQNGEHHHPK